MTHHAQLRWIPAEARHQLICDDCGQLLLGEVEGFVFEVEGECRPGERLTVQVRERVGVRDVFSPETRGIDASI